MTSEFVKNKFDKKSLAEKFKPVVYGALSLMIVAAVVTYLIQVNKIAAYGFEIKKLEKEINLVKAENEKLSVTVVELQSMPTVQGKIASLNMVPAEQVVYLDVPGQTVARR